MPALLLSLLGVLAGLMPSSPAAAQWKWRDAQGRVQYSDRPPPTTVPDRDILTRPAAARTPGTGTVSGPPGTGASGPVPGSTGGAAPASAAASTPARARAAGGSSVAAWVWPPCSRGSHSTPARPST